MPKLAMLMLSVFAKSMDIVDAPSSATGGSWLLPNESFHLDCFLPWSDDVLVDTFWVILRVVATLPEGGRVAGAALLVHNGSGMPYMEGGSNGVRLLRRDVLIVPLDPLCALATLCLLFPLRKLDVDGRPALGTRSRGTSSMLSDSAFGALTRLISRASC